MSRFFDGTTSRPHLLAGNGQGKEIRELISDIDGAFQRMEAAVIAQLTSLITPVQATDADGIMTAQASAATPQTFTGTNFDGLLAPGTAGATISVPKRILVTIAGTTATDFLGGTCTFVGTDVTGAAQTETAVLAAGAQTTTLTKYFASLTSASFPASTSTGATIMLGVAAETGCIASGLSSTSVQTFNTDAQFRMASVGRRQMDVARALALVLSNNAAFTGGSLTVYGIDINGADISEVFTIPNGGNTTVNGTKFFARIVRAVMTAQGSAAGTWSLGIRDTILGLPRRSAVGAIAAVGLREASRADSATAFTVPSAGTLTAPASALPNGSWTPAVAPQGAAGHILVYIAA
jgi:hypothetical protein